MIKRLMLWKRVKVNEHRYIDINTDNAFNEATTGATFTETAYEINGKFIGVVEYPDDTIQEQIDNLITEYLAFEFTFITEDEANILLAELTDDVGGVSVKNFIFEDTRKVDLI